MQSRNLCASCISSDIDDCYPNPCENNGTCIDGVNKYTCACVPGFEGKNCTISKFLNKSFKQTFLYLPFEIAKIKAREMPSHKNREIKYQGILSDIDIPANVKTMGLVTME